LWFRKCLGMLRQKASDYNTLAITYTPRSSPLPTSSLRLYCGEPATLRSSRSSQVAVLSMYLWSLAALVTLVPINSVAFNHDSDLMASGGTSGLWFITQELIKCQQAMTVTWWSGSVRMVNAFRTSPLEAYPCPQSALGQNSKLRASSQSLLLLGCQDGSIHLYRMISKHQLYMRVLNLRCKHSIVDLGLFSSHMATNLSGQRKHIVIP